LAANTIDEYIEGFPGEVQVKLVKIRELIQQLVPEALEVMSYGVPGFKLKKNLVSFAAFKNHTGLYPTPSAIEAFKKELSEYKTAPGTIQFPYSKPLPYDLIGRIVTFRVREVSA